MTAQQIIEKFEQYVDDNSTMSTQETLDLLNKVYRRVLAAHRFQITKTFTTGSVAAGEITLPSDFRTITKNRDHRQVVFVGTKFDEYQVIPFDERRDYRDQSGYVYLDMRNSKLVFTKDPGAVAYEFDYHYIPADLTLTDTPIIPVIFQDCLYHGMAHDFAIIDNTPKNRSYAEEQLDKYDEILENLALWDLDNYGRTDYCLI